MELWPPDFLDIGSPGFTLHKVVILCDADNNPSFVTAQVTKGAKCLACSRPCAGKIRICLNRFTGSHTMTCPSNQHPRKQFMSNLTKVLLFGGKHSYPSDTPPSRVPLHTEPVPDCDADSDDDTDPILPPPDGVDGRQNPSPHPNSLTVLQYNMDKRGHRTLGHLLSLAEETHADVVCLQETENVAWSTHSLSSLGWNLYRHRKVAILLRRTTSERLSVTKSDTGQPCHHIWRSQNYDTMSVSLATPEGNLMIGCAYIPPGVDTMPEVSTHQPVTRPSVSLIHQELLTQSLLHSHSILCMDRNETTSPGGRVQIRHDGSLTLSGAQSGVTPTMSCYDSSLVNTVKHISNTDPSTVPLHLMTHIQPGPGMTIHSDIDTVYCSKTLVARLTHAGVDDRTRLWGAPPNRPRTSFHKAIICRWQWQGLWPSPQGSSANSPELQGTQLPRGPDYSAWSDCKAANISKRLDAVLSSPKKKLEVKKILRARNYTPSQRRDALCRLLKRSLVSITGRALPQRSHVRPGPDRAREAPERWETLISLIARVLKRTIVGHLGPPLTLSDPRVTTVCDWFAHSGVSFPSTIAG